jgi:hypothetical protein
LNVPSLPSSFLRCKRREEREGEMKIQLVGNVEEITRAAAVIFPIFGSLAHVKPAQVSQLLSLWEENVPTPPDTVAEWVQTLRLARGCPDRSVLTLVEDFALQVQTPTSAAKISFAFVGPPHSHEAYLFEADFGPKDEGTSRISAMITQEPELQWSVYSYVYVGEKPVQMAYDLSLFFGDSYLELLQQVREAPRDARAIWASWRCDTPQFGLSDLPPLQERLQAFRKYSTAMSWQRWGRR